MDVTTETFERDVIERSQELPVVVDFWAAWCGPCRMLGPALEAEAQKRAGQLELVKLDVEAEPQLAARYGIQSIPTVAVFRDGEPVTGFVGAQPARVIGDFFDEHVLAEPVAERAADETRAPSDRRRSRAAAIGEHKMHHKFVIESSTSRSRSPGTAVDARPRASTANSRWRSRPRRSSAAPTRTCGARRTRSSRPQGRAWR